MNFALPALTVFALLLPGFIARSRLKRIERASLDFSPFGQIVTGAVVWAVGLHLVWITLMHGVTTKVWDPDLVLSLVAADDTVQTAALRKLGKQAADVALYFMSLVAFAYATPAAARRFIIWQRLDRADSPFSWLMRFDRAPWYYILSGADFSEEHEPDIIRVSAVVPISGAAYVYRGYLENYYLNDEGNLDRMVLTAVGRRPLNQDKTKKTSGGPEVATDDSQEERFYPIDGDYFVLRYSECITLNIEYLEFHAEESG